jgi:hypothetical protein
MEHYVAVPARNVGAPTVATHWTVGGSQWTLQKKQLFKTLTGEVALKAFANLSSGQRPGLLSPIPFCRTLKVFA